MRKMLILASALSVLGAGGATAQDFRPSSQNDFPVARTQQYTASVDRGIVTSGIGTAGVSAAQGFGPSDQNNLPAPRSQMQHGSAEREVTTSSTGADKRRYTGYNASDNFGASY